MPELRKEHNRWEWHGTFDERIIAKNAGFYWDGLNRVWYTEDDDKANLLSQYKVEDDRRVAVEFEPTPESAPSYATTTDYIPPSPEGLSYFPYQRAGIEFMEARDSVLLADEMGLGKTIQICGYLNALHRDGKLEGKRILLVSPASLTLNWARELKKWLIWDASIRTYLKTPKPSTDVSYFAEPEISIFSYERLCTTFKKHYVIARRPSVDRKVAVFNPDSNLDKLFDVVILDEAHYCKSEETKRTLVTMWFAKNAERKVFMTGTPILNRPIELWSLLNTLDPTVWNNRDHYATYYCNRHLKPIYYKRRDGGTAQKKMVWVEDGANHLEEINEILRTSIMIRRTKKAVLTQLPEKFVQTLVLPVSCEEVAEESNLWNEMCAKYGEDEAVRRIMGRSYGVELNEAAKIRQNVALAKIPYLTEIIDNIIESQTDGKVIVMAHHRAVVDALMDALKAYNPVKVVGGMSAEQKQESVDAFQKSVDTKVFIGNIQAAGVGLTLTASHTVLFAELDWGFGTMQQAMDRAYRIGQTKAVNVYYAVIQDSLDEYLLNMVKHKENIADILLQ